MKKNSMFLVLACMLIIVGCAQSPVGEMKFPEGTVQHVVHARIFNESHARHTCQLDFPRIYQKINSSIGRSAYATENSRTKLQ